jgi:O-antigen ligase
MVANMHPRMSQSVATHLKLACIAVAFLFLALAACGSETPPLASDPPGALVRLQRNVAATTLPGDFTVFSNGGLQLYLGDRGALRKTVAPADLAGLQATLNDPALDTLADTYPAALPTSAGDTLTIYGAHRRMIRYDPSSPDLPPALQRLTGEVMELRRRF